MNQNPRQNLISTKLHPPNLTRNNIARSLVPEILADNAGQSAYVVATTGFGKSTILRQIYDALANDGVKCGWLSLDDHDSAPTTFLRYFCELLSNVGAINQAEIYQQTSLTDAAGIDLAFSLLNQAAARITEPVAIFLDDLQLVHDKRTLGAFAAFLDAKSDKLRVFFATRHTPELQMQRREMNGSFFRVDASALKFTQREAEQFFEASLGKNPRPADIAQLLKATEGWPAGLQIATLSQSSVAGKSAAIPTVFSGSSGQVAQYLSDNVFRSLPENVQDFLLATGPLNRFCSDLCRFVRGRDGNKAAIEWLLDKNLFLVALDSSGTWYRYHHLFSDFLIAMARKLGHHERDDICHKASIWCLENGLVDEAINYLLDVGDFDEAARQIAQASPRIARQHGDTVTMIRWMESLPKTHQMMHPEMMLDHAFSLAFSLATDQADAIVDDVRQVLARADPEDPETEALFALADTVEALALAARDLTDEALTHIAATRRKWLDADPGTQGILSNIAAYCHMTHNQPAQAAKEVTSARMQGLRSGVGYVSIWADCIDAMSHCRSGDLDGAAEPLGRALHDASAEGESDLQRLLVHMLAADMAYLRGNLPLAREELAKGTGFSASFGPAEPLLISHRVRAWCAALAGDHARALELTEHGVALGLRHGVPRLTLSLIGQQISFLTLAGQTGAANRLAERWGVLDDSWKSRFRPETEALHLIQKKILAELAICEGRFDEAVIGINLLERRLKSNIALADAVRLKILKSHALAQIGQTDDAAREISKAARLSHDSGTLVPFLEYAACATPLLQDVIQRREMVDTPRDILEASAEGQLLALIMPKRAEAKPEDAEEEEDAIDALTEREIELLRLIESGMTNAQIAAHLVITVATVKWHLHNAFQKLGVRNRMGALAAARKHGLLEG